MRAMRIRAYSYRIGALLSGAALLAGTALALGATGVAAQAPPTVPQYRAFGTVTVNGHPAPSGTTVTAQAVTGNTVCGTGTVTGTGGSYFVDVQSIAGCTGNVVFLVNGQPTNSGPVTAPDIQGSSKALNLTVVAATPSPTPPAAPTVIATTAPPPPPPPPPPTIRPATPPPPPTVTTTPRPTVVVPVTPPNTGVGPGPSRVPSKSVQAPTKSVQAPKTPVQAPVVAQAVAQAPKVAPKLPNTGTGGLLQSQTGSSSSPWFLAGLALAVSLLFGSAAVAYRRNHAR